ncbi:MAG: hypothetical protein GX295_03980 [Syntrophomonadaceae bacterium]|nr:hypothetical protein [Syntrophomonadaceae bacterium]
MNKQDIYTTVGVAFSLMIAFCGWILTNTLLDKQETVLLSVTGSIHAPSVLGTTAGTGNDANSNSTPKIKTELITDETKLEEGVMAKILANWNAPKSHARPHEPVEGQLSMEQAITAAKNGLSHFNTHGIIPPELLKDEFTRTNASLWENQPAIKENQSDTRVKVSMELPPEYSYWAITFGNEKMSVQLTLNAVTGAIWRADIFSYQAGTIFANLDVVEMVEIYAAYLGLNGGDSLSFNETWASKGFAGDIISVTATKNETGVDSTKSYSGISLYLSEFGRSARYMNIVVEK